MRPEGNPLDLNNLPDDQYPRDHGVTGNNEKEGGEDDRKEEECGKVYECRFCSLKFCKSQALGGHMNRHRQEKETEKLNNARQLLLRNDHNLVSQGALHLGCCQPIATTGYHPTTNMGYPRSFSGSSSSSTHMPMPPPQPSPPPLYASPSRPVSPFQQQYLIPMNDYQMGHVMNSSHQQYRHPNMNYVAGASAAVDSSSYTCIGAPVGQGLNWRPGYSEAQQQQHRLDPSNSTINLFQDQGF